MNAPVQLTTREDLKHVIHKHLRLLAPEADIDALRPHDDICETLEVDALDFHNYLLAVKAETGVEAPEQDHWEINTIDKLTTYLLIHLGLPTNPGP